MIRYKYIYIIYNPKSTGRSKSIAETFEDTVRRNMPSAHVEIHATKYAGHMSELVPSLLGKKQQVLFVSSSGDGGYNELVNATMSTKKLLQLVDCAVLPAGNANDHSRTMHSRSLVKKFPYVKRTRLDLLKITVNQTTETTLRYAHSYAGLGVTPEIAKELNQYPFKPFREIRLVLKAIHSFKPFRIQHGRKILKLDSLLFINIYQMAKYLTLADKNRPRDGKFELVMFKHRIKGLLLIRLLKATLSFARPQKRLRRYRFVTLQHMSMQLDGEVIHLQEGDKVTVSVAYRALRTII